MGTRTRQRAVKLEFGGFEVCRRVPNETMGVDRRVNGR